MAKNGETKAKNNPPLALFYIINCDINYLTDFPAANAKRIPPHFHLKSFLFMGEEKKFADGEIIGCLKNRESVSRTSHERF